MIRQASLRLMAVAILAVLIGVGSAWADGSVIFSDDFESGNLDQWTIGGRQQNTSIAETPGTSNLTRTINLASGQYFWRVRATYDTFNHTWSANYSLK